MSGIDTSYTTILNSIADQMAAAGGENQAQIAARLQRVRHQFGIDQDSFSLIVATIADFDPDGTYSRDMVADAMETAVWRGSCRLDSLDTNTETLGDAHLDLLRRVIAGGRRGDKAFEPASVFWRNSIGGIRTRPEVMVAICEEKGGHYRLADRTGFPMDQAARTYLTPELWAEYVGGPYQGGNFLVMWGNLYGVVGENTGNLNSACPDTSPWSSNDEPFRQALQEWADHWRERDPIEEGDVPEEDEEPEIYTCLPFEADEQCDPIEDESGCGEDSLEEDLDELDGVDDDEEDISDEEIGVVEPLDPDPNVEAAFQGLIDALNSVDTSRVVLIIGSKSLIYRTFQFDSRVLMKTNPIDGDVLPSIASPDAGIEE